MNDEKKISERDAVMRERRAFAAARCSAIHELHFRMGEGHEEPCRVCQTRAKEEFALPKVTRPRVVRDESDIQWRFVDGYLQWTTRFKSGWLRTQEYEGMAIPSDRIKLWADLLANPTEEIEVGADS